MLCFAGQLTNAADFENSCFVLGEGNEDPAKCIPTETSFTGYCTKIAKDGQLGSPAYFLQQ